MVMKNDREEEVSLEESCCVWLVRGEAGVIMQRLSFSGFSGLPKHWERETTPGGREYYVHKLTGWATYQKPQPLPSGWEMAQDKAKGQVYYWNTKTRETRYLDWLGAPPSMPPSDLRFTHEFSRARGPSIQGRRVEATW